MTKKSGGQMIKLVKTYPPSFERGSVANPKFPLIQTLKSYSIVVRYFKRIRGHACILMLIWIRNSHGCTIK